MSCCKHVSIKIRRFYTAEITKIWNENTKHTKNAERTKYKSINSDWQLSDNSSRTVDADGGRMEVKKQTTYLFICCIYCLETLSCLFLTFSFPSAPQPCLFSSSKPKMAASVSPPPFLKKQTRKILFPPYSSLFTSWKCSWGHKKCPVVASMTSQTALSHTMASFFAYP